MNRYIAFFWVLVFLADGEWMLYGQDGENYYKHFSGEIEGNMYLSMDIHAVGETVTGHYYYFFYDVEADGSVIKGKNIPLTGTRRSEGFIVSEFSQGISVFTVDYLEDNTFTGYWKQQQEGKILSVKLREDYSGGSIPLCVQSLKRNHSALQGSDSPKAAFSASLLVPCSSENSAVNDSLVKALALLFSLPADKPEASSFAGTMAENFVNSYMQSTEGIEDMTNASSFNWENGHEMYVVFNEKNILSIRYEKYVYTGGAHGISLTSFLNINLMDGSILETKDIFLPGSEEYLDQMLNQKIRRINRIGEDEKLSESGFFSDVISDPGHFYVNSDGIGFFYNVYAIAPYSAGTTELFFTFDEIKGILKPGFFSF